MSRSVPVSPLLPVSVPAGAPRKLRAHGGRVLEGALVAALLVLTPLPGPRLWALDLAGTVTLAVDGSPIDGARVRYLREQDGARFEATTAADGSYLVHIGEPAAWAGLVEEGAGTVRPRLGKAYPNPFGASTAIPFSLDEPTRARLDVFDALGRRVRRLLDEDLPAGLHQALWDGRTQEGWPAAPGVYFVRLGAWGGQAVGKVVRLCAVGPGAPQPVPSAPAFDTTLVLYTIEVERDAIATLRRQQVSIRAPDFSADLQVDPARLEIPLAGGPSLTMVAVPASPFAMGSTQYQDEQPVHRVILDTYYLGWSEVTVRQYQACVEAGACLEPARGEACNWGQPGHEDHPVNCVSWYDASRFCLWAGVRLPTEAEWEKGARGTEGRTYPWGDESPGGAGNCDRALMMRAGLGLGCGYDGTGPVASIPGGASPYGLMDMAGNVWEWVADWYDRGFYHYSLGPNPANVEPGDYKSARGNSWYYVDADPDMRAANRFRFRPHRWNPYTGFRCALSAHPVAPQLTAVGAPDAVERAALLATDWLQRNRLAAAAEGDTLPAGVAAEPEMVVVPAGEFLMGNDRGQGDERPAHRVYLSEYRIDRREVTVAEYQACVEAGACSSPHKGGRYRLRFEDGYLDYGKPERSNYPVNAVSWFQAEQYCGWAGKRLPTEAEWEKAARGPDGRRYPWGDQEPACERAVMDDGGDGCGHESPWPVGAKPAGASPYGVLDLAGNVWEWVSDWYDHDYYKRSPASDPHRTEPGPTAQKVLRGGSLADQNPQVLAASNRLGYNPAQGNDYTIGFRCASD